MKKLLLTASLVLATSSLMAQTYVMVIEKNDGSKINVKTNDIKQISFSEVTAPTVNDLLGNWNSWKIEEWAHYYTFTENQVTIKEGTEVEYQGPYAYDNGIVTIKNEDETIESSALLYDGSVMAIKKIYVAEDGTRTERLDDILYKEGKTVAATSDDIQGFWSFYTDTEEGRDTRLAFKFTGNQFECYIWAWGQKYVGNYTYTNGIVHLNVTNGFTSREPGSGHGSGSGGVDPYTLEGEWNELYEENWVLDFLSDFPFIVDGDKAYGIMNMPGIYRPI